MSEHQHYCLFGEPWWLDIVSGPGGWDEVRIEASGQLDARLPYRLHKSRGLVRIGMPRFTQTLGPWFASSPGKYAGNISRQNKLTDAIIRQLPKHHAFSQSFHSEITNLLPWHWQEFAHTTRYSYFLDDLSSDVALWAAMEPNIRSDIRKATKRHELVARDDLGADALIEICNKTASRQNRQSMPRQLVRRIVERTTDMGHGRSLLATDAEGRVHAGVFIVWDERCAYYLLGGGDPELRGSGAHSFLLWEAIRFASAVSKAFDFEGSMVPAIERFFRAFGARQRPYPYVWRNSGRVFGAANHLRDAYRALRGA